MHRARTTLSANDGVGIDSENEPANYELARLNDVKAPHGVAILLPFAPLFTRQAYQSM